MGNKTFQTSKIPICAHLRSSALICGYTSSRFSAAVHLLFYPQIFTDEDGQERTRRGVAGSAKESTIPFICRGTVSPTLETKSLPRKGAEGAERLRVWRTCSAHFAPLRGIFIPVHNEVRGGMDSQSPWFKNVSDSGKTSGTLVLRYPPPHSPRVSAVALKNTNPA